MKPERFARRWRRRHRKLLVMLDETLRSTQASGGAVPIHELRVTLRRLRLSVRLGKGLFDEALVGRLRTWAAGISRATSPVRDLDIAVDWLKAARAGPALVQECEKRRTMVWRRRQRHLRPAPPRLRASLDVMVSEKQARSALEKRFVKLEARYRDHVKQQLAGFLQLGEEERHEFRRMIRWWRYLRELSVSKRKQAKDPGLRLLVAVQEALGDLQNLALVETAFKSLTPSAELAELQALLARQQTTQIVEARRVLAVLKSRVK